MEKVINLRKLKITNIYYSISNNFVLDVYSHDNESNWHMENDDRDDSFVDDYSGPNDDSDKENVNPKKYSRDSG